MSVVELAAHRHPETSTIIAGLGFEHPMEWRVISLLSPTFRFRRVVAEPCVAAIHRGCAKARFVHVSVGDPVASPPLKEEIEARMHAYVAARSLVEAGQHVRSGEVAIVYRDGKVVALEPLQLRSGEPMFDRLFDEVAKKRHVVEIAVQKLVPRLVREIRAGRGFY